MPNAPGTLLLNNTNTAMTYHNLLLTNVNQLSVTTIPNTTQGGERYGTKRMCFKVACSDGSEANVEFILEDGCTITTVPASLPQGPALNPECGE